MNTVMNGHPTKKDVKRMVSSKILMVTPELAQEWLLKNQNNRPLKEQYVEFYLDQMRKGHWGIQNDDICFDWDGNLINGQHRLNAVVRYRKPVQMGIKTGLDPQTFTIIDGNLAKRTIGDVLSVAGINNSNAKGAIARFYLDYKKGRFVDRGSAARKKTGNTEIVKFVENNIKKIDEVYSFTKKITKKFNSIQGRYLGAMYWLLSEIDMEKANHFFDLYGSGIGLYIKHPVYVLRQKLIAEMSSVKKYHITDKLAFFVIAWNNYRQGKSISYIKYTDKSEFPKPI